MLVRCPQCREPIRLVEFEPRDRVVPYLCPSCESIVRIDLILDEVKTTAAAASFQDVRSTRTVLVVDDCQGSGEVVAGILLERGYDVRVVNDGDSALQAIHEVHPDLVVLDLMLPGLSSFDVLRHVRHDARLGTTPVLVVGSKCTADVLHYLHELGADGFLDRERVVETLAFRVRTLLDSHPAGAVVPPARPSHRPGA